mmetsp:Transcript_31300/g.81777  ORF Transcript_31300/g.81777 Transcript_31300/m.81777 type:complete len:211 (+) Transcript_31300:363-995(+)
MVARSRRPPPSSCSARRSAAFARRGRWRKRRPKMVGARCASTLTRSGRCAAGPATSVQRRLHSLPDYQVSPFTATRTLGAVSEWRAAASVASTFCSRNLRTIARGCSPHAVSMRPLQLQQGTVTMRSLHLAATRSLRIRGRRARRTWRCGWRAEFRTAARRRRNASPSATAAVSRSSSRSTAPQSSSCPSCSHESRLTSAPGPLRTGHRS